MKYENPIPASWRTALAVALPLLLGLAARLFALKKLFLAIGDSLIYGDIARNLLLHGQYALTGSQELPHSTLIRLPGYPLLLAALFRLFGMENYWAASCLQIVLDLAGCLLLADFVRRTAPAALARRAALDTLWLSCLCPFTLSYTAAPMAEVPTLFTIALAMWSMTCFRLRPGWMPALSFTFAILWAAMLRPDGALVAVALAPAALIGLPRKQIVPGQLVRMATVCTLLTILPFLAWTARNWKVFHTFQPLAPRLANDPGEDPYLGWEAWIKSWCLDFNCTYNIYWNVPGDRFDLSMLPERAWETPDEKAELTAIAALYNQKQSLSHDLDLRFAALAARRTQQHPLRTRVLLPAGRLASMWIGPRIENLPVDLSWRNNARSADFWITCALLALNFGYLLLAAIGFGQRPELRGALLAYIVLRSVMLLSVQAPETRYTLECFPMLLALGGIAIAHLTRKRAVA